VIAYFKRAFMQQRMQLVMRQSDQSGTAASGSGAFQITLYSTRWISTSATGEYRVVLQRTAQGWRITDLRLEGRNDGSPQFAPPKIQRPPRFQAPPQPQPVFPGFGVVPLSAS